jgi:hypothetical protein
MVMPVSIRTRSTRATSGRGVATALCAALVALSLGCGSMGRPRLPAYAYEGEILLASSLQAHHWMRSEFQRVPHLRDAVKRYGVPKYLVMVDRRTVHLVYVERDSVVSVNLETNWLLAFHEPRSRVALRFEVPPVLLALLPAEDQRQIRSARLGEEPRQEAQRSHEGQPG